MSQGGGFTYDAWSTPDPWGPSPTPVPRSVRAGGVPLGREGSEDVPYTPPPSESEGEGVGAGKRVRWVRLAAPGQGGAHDVVVFDEALRVLARMEGPAAVVGMLLLGPPHPAAQYGEAEAQARLLGATLEGDATTCPTTPQGLGMWVWDAPRARRAADGTPMHAAVVACRPGQHLGLGALTVVLTSALVVVHAGPADNAFLERMAFVRGLAAAAQSWAGRRMAPSLLVVLHGLDLGAIQRRIDPDAYLDAALEGRGRSADLDATREAIRGLFLDRHCVCVPGGCGEGSGRGEEALLAVVAGYAGCPKRVGHVAVPGPMLADLACSLAARVAEAAGGDRGGLARRMASLPGDAWEEVRERCCRSARERAAAVYAQERAAGKRDSSDREGDAEREHQRCAFAALAAFRACAVGELDVLAHHEALLLRQARRIDAEGAEEFVPEERHVSSPYGGAPAAAGGGEGDERDDAVDAALAAFHRATERARVLSGDLSASMDAWKGRHVGSIDVEMS